MAWGEGIVIPILLMRQQRDWEKSSFSQINIAKGMAGANLKVGETLTLSMASK